MNGNTNEPTQTIAKYDRLRGSLQDVALFTRPSTIKNVQTMTGRTETFVVETCRYEELGGDFIFIECVDDTGVTRIALPPKVANAISAQRDSLTSRRRSIAGRRRGALLTDEQRQELRDRLSKARKAKKKTKK